MLVLTLVVAMACALIVFGRTKHAPEPLRRISDPFNYRPVNEPLPPFEPPPGLLYVRSAPIKPRHSSLLRFVLILLYFMMMMITIILIILIIVIIIIILILIIHFDYFF